MELIKEHPDLTLELAKVGNAAAGRLSQRLLLAHHSGVRERLIWELLELGRRFGRWEEPGLVIELGLSKRDLGRLVGAEHSSMAKVTRNLEERGQAIFRRQMICLPNPLQLSQVLRDPEEVRSWRKIPVH